MGLSIYPFISKGSSHEAFIPTAILFLVFSLPLFFFLKETPKQQKAKQPFLSGYKEIKSTFKEMRSYRSVFTFMIAYFFLNDAIATTIGMMAVYAKTVVGFSSSGFILLYSGIDSIEYCRIVSVWVYHSVEGTAASCDICGNSALGRFIYCGLCPNRLFGSGLQGVCSAFRSGRCG